MRFILVYSVETKQLVCSNMFVDSTFSTWNRK